MLEAADMCSWYAGRPLKRQRSLLNITKGLLRTTASEIASIASAPVRAGSSTLFGSRANNDSAVPEAPSPRTISFGVRNNLSRPLEVGHTRLSSRLLDAK